VPYDRASANRVFGYALLASIVLHVLLLVIRWPQLGDALKHPVEVLAPIVARLMAPPPAPSPPAPPPPAPAPPVEKPAAAAPAPKPKPQPRPEAKPVPAPRQEPQGIAEPAPGPAPTPIPAPAPPVAAVKPQPAAPAVPAAPDTASLIAQYRAALLAEAGRHKRYPLVALDNGWEGEVVVRMAIAADGSLAALSVKTSSGHAALDRQALEMFRKAGAEVPAPEALRGRRFSLELRAVYNLKDQTSG
jgi:protein TonB